ncbi:hypothetical protein [Mameliella sediminis]|uniref:hypothetical protein n=1 Tax=Mameliella sediminis TaxID=2836866 RepID=UPI001C459DAD|nr:hypothetical protein [Mameliella sediminis]MBY6114199.1 hypothetical protein [Antarctobacter heliothermus]MBY6142453.1 hypothetical protein [Mameliella alba]MBV7395496.1 hypothetical protein [Mameliella sediminis]MBY6159281.1 hypothetical protein [Mameliella alba]MBY6167752.1 hypothetical protein [Mameliella alba]
MYRRAFLRSALAAPALVAAPALAQDNALKIRELYEKNGDMSAIALDGAGQRLTFEGFMAPPLKAESQFFVLTKMPMSVCPFCETEAEWPDDILAVYTKRVVEVLPYNVKITARGVLELGSYKDPETGFVSLVRLTDATYGED